MAGIIWNKGENAIIGAWLGGQSSYGSPQLVPAPGGAWGLGLGCRVGGVGVLKTDTITQIIELGTTAAAGYARVPITRDQSAGGWPAPAITGGSYQTTAAQQSYTFTGTPNPNGATLWFLAGNTTITHDNAIFGADLAATRTFGNGDNERVVPSYQQT